MNYITLVPKIIIKEAKEWESAAKDFVDKKREEAEKRAETAEEKKYKDYMNSRVVGFKW